jgi:xanthosine utilization system XapX-like protein
LTSDLLNPLFLPPIVLGSVSWLLYLSGPAIGWIIGISFIFYTVIPFLAAFYLLNKNHISSLDLPQRKSRYKLYTISIGSSLAAFFCISLMNYVTGPVPGIIALTFFINLLVGFLINLTWKISIHTAALTSAGAIFLFFSQTGVIALSVSNIFSLTILLVLLPLMIWARLHLRVHTVAELFGGALSGFALTILELSMLTNIW